MKIGIDSGLQNLLNLNDSVLDQGDGYWIKIVAWSVLPTVFIPHGIRYSLTLHEPFGKRIMGYDNAHGHKPASKFKYAGLRVPYDHKHRHAADEGVLYQFVDAHQLLSDFFVEADRVLAQHRAP